MIFDHYASLADQRTCPTSASKPDGLVSGFVDGCTAWSTRGNSEKNDARRCYIKHVDGTTSLALPQNLKLSSDFTALPDTGWIGIEVAFTLDTPWFSKDDRTFHVIDNPVRKDRVFGVPFMAAASWKGMLRWACRMRGMKSSHILHLFGNDKGEARDFQRGALAFYPTWFDRLGFEVINPHSRKTRAGTQPIYYEVVPKDAKGVLHLLYAPFPGRPEASTTPERDSLRELIGAIEALLTIYGISAKRTAGWGTARPSKWTAFRKGENPTEQNSASALQSAVTPWFG